MTCHICGDTGVYQIIAPGHRSHGSTGYCDCAAGRVLFNQRRNELRARAGIPSRMYGLDFDWYKSKFPMGVREKQLDLMRGRFAAFMAAQSLAEKGFLDKRGIHVNGMGITGPVGTGKTTLAVAVCTAVLDLGVPVRFTTVPDLLDTIRDSFGAYRANEGDYPLVMQQYSTVPLLVLDDLGAQRETEFALEKLYQIVNARLEAGLSTIFTANYPLPDPTGLSGDWARIVRRLRDGCAVFHFGSTEEESVG